MPDDLVFGIGGDNTGLKNTTTEAEQIIDRWVAEATATIESLDATIPIEIDADLARLRSEFNELAELSGSFSLDVDASNVEELKSEIILAIGELQKGSITTDEFSDRIKGLTSDTKSLSAAVAQVVRESESLGSTNIQYNVDVEGFQRQLAEAANTENFTQAGEDIANALDPYAVRLDEINAKNDAHIDGAAEVVKELQEMHDAANDVSERFSKILNTSKQIFTAASTLVVSIQQTNAFIKARAEEHFKIQQLRETEIAQEKELAKLQEDRLRALTDQAKEESNTGESRTLDQLNEELKAAENNSASLLRIRKKLNADLQEEERKREEFVNNSNAADNVLALTDVTFGSDLTEAQERFDAVNRKLEESNQAYQKIKDAISEVEAATTSKADKEKAASDEEEKNLNRRIELLKLEAELVSKTGEEREAVQRQIDQINADQSTNTTEQAGRVAAAQAELRAAKEAAEAKKQADQDRERSQKETERFEERLATQRERSAASEDRLNERRGRLERRQQNERERANRPIGGVDSSLQAAISRIQSSANSPDPLRELAERHQQENRTFEKTAAQERAKQTIALEKLAANKPTEAPGLL